jgi:acetyl esterase/lipase
MIRTLPIVVLLAVAAVAGCSRPQQGAMSQEELRREPIRFELDIPYAGTGNPRQRLDLYLPKTPGAGKLPVIVFLHGGGWRYGDKASGAAQLMPFVRSGQYAGVSAGYRLTDEAVWPAQIHDSKAAIRWIRANADKYGLAPQRIAVWGRSAGAHLALMLGFTGDVPELEGDVGPHDDLSSEVSGVVNFYGITDIPALIGQPSDIDRTDPQAPEARLVGGVLPDRPELARAASPLSYVTPDDPPVLTLHGTADRTVPYDQAVRLDRALTGRACPVISFPLTGPTMAASRMRRLTGCETSSQKFCSATT